MHTVEKTSRPTPDVQDMVLVHRCFRQVFTRAPELVRTLPEGDRERIQLVTDRSSPRTWTTRRPPSSRS
ncbi:hypothetical protein [Nocardia sp. NPDC020380]|uniref:hypothetical protein n=1 Tax=Nocardia sp. NPDC020380 TaxID=3364309 RepID=UPI0037B1BAF9